MKREQKQILLHVERRGKVGTLAVRAYVLDGLWGIHRTPFNPDKGEGWSVTHAPSGLVVATLPTKARAIEVAERFYAAVKDDRSWRTAFAVNPGPAVLRLANAVASVLGKPNRTAKDVDVPRKVRAWWYPGDDPFCTVKFRVRYEWY